MASRLPVVVGPDGLFQQLQSADSLTASGLTAPSATSANIPLGGGYILKAGQVTSTSGGVATVTFPIAFPTAVISITATLATGSASTTTNYSVNVSASSKSGFTLQVNQIVTALLILSAAGGVAAAVHWQAVGY